ncbi:Metallo-dependent phosphatase [Stereum hirsutum FP-91666 SS1]|uniref:Metallo-dependent phosphatase n=1 Tax=Stereum hirsutum (strain FP-91666) TaxID=721885 RepID=UPI000440E182|nr:Metallo-dependent phosphatase [Stereum hirsutum FP-91666 SS1]EIM92818.1 Metallo-dependent phosphatase [Stereum hirsutum FP-91666 SS1]
MSLSCNRFFRFLRSIFVPTTTILAFSCLLLFFFILYQPTDGPGDQLRLGWQSWDYISSSSEASYVVPDGTDWWNVTAPEGEAVDSASLPLDIWNPLLPHDTGLSEIMIVRCMFASQWAEMCAPKSSKEDEAIKGKWVRVDPDLNIQSGMWHLNVYYRRTRRLDVRLITNIQLLPTDAPEPPPSTPGSTWTKADLSIRDGVYKTEPLFLWFETGKTAGEMTAEEKQNLITEIDVTYGDGNPWFGFEKLSPATTERQEGLRENVWLTYRKGVKAVPRAPPLHFSRDGRFKIMQVADLHFSVSAAPCRDTNINCDPGAFNVTSTLIGQALDIEKPDLVIFTGDQLNGQGSAWDAKSILAKFAYEVTSRQIPWAAVFGNHDDEDARETGWKKDQIKMMQAMPYSLVKAGPEDVHGEGNYVLKVLSADASKTHLLTMYFLDSGSYSKGFIDWFGFFTPTEYDWIHEVPSISPIERPFTPDGTRDMGDLWARQDQVAPQTRKLAKPNALMFFHIPLQEAYAAPDVHPDTGALLNVGLHSIENPGAAKTNGGMFSKGLLQATESPHTGNRGIPEVKVVGNGHCHITENCKRVNNVWQCFGGGGSYAGYGRVGFDRRFRIYDISDYGETIKTYKRLASDKVMNEMVLAGRGAPPYLK